MISAWASPLNFFKNIKSTYFRPALLDWFVSVLTRLWRAPQISVI